MSEYTIESIDLSHRNEIIDIFNYYVENSFAAYFENKVPYEFFDILMQSNTGYPSVVIKNEQNEIVAFGMLRPHSAIPSFSVTAETTYFVKDGYKGKGIGSMLLAELVSKAKDINIHSLLANISSINEESLMFHKKKGFSECGRFAEVGIKHGTTFDTVWMQKFI
ncbi:N-acetyltransferase family protein [Methanolobus sp. WCC4]|uniref:GNAT family N-acetyltransferase n=1 Tax=Methanolobus sp. WCC4 TaxID=3125784 RepID=UPI0030FA60F8